MILAVCPNPSVDTYLYMDSFQLKKSSRITNKERFAGGKGVHIALAATELGEKVKLLAFWGGDTGQWIKTQCENLGIECIGPELSEENRTCYTIKTSGENDDTEILELGPHINSSDFESFISIFKENISEAQTISLSGSWPQGAPNNAYGEMIKICNEQNKPHIIDATGNMMQAALKEKPFGIHINKQESLELFGSDDPNQVLNNISLDIKIVALTAGKEGLYLRLNNQKKQSNVVLKQIYSAVGSGDCLTAGLCISLKNNSNIEDTVRLATACGAANCLRPELGMLYKKDVEKLKKEVSILNFTDE